MKRLLVFVFLCVCVLFLCCAGEAKAAPRKQQNDNKVYIVYMGAAASSNGGAMRKDQAQLMTSLIRRKRNALVYSYTNGFSGFAARLTEEEARTMTQKPGVVSVFPEPILKLHTTRSWDFLELLSENESFLRNKSVHAESSSRDSDTIIGILDTGIWPESLSFNDDGMGPIPARWKGKCESGDNFNASNCNRKLIGARYYTDTGSPRDDLGHGTHVASTAAGSIVDGASYYGLATGVAKGGSPSSRIAMYQVCPGGGCPGSYILKAFNDAIGDGVDILSLSLGGAGGAKPDFTTDVVAIGAFHAVEKGIVVVCSAGNDGPDRGTVVNEAPWIFTVAASTVDRDFESQIVLGDNKVIKGGGIHFGQLKKTPAYPLVTGASAKMGNVSEKTARECASQTLDSAKVKGNIIVCESKSEFYGNEERAEEVNRAGGVGIIIIVKDEDRLIAPKFATFPGSIVTENDGNQIFTYISTTKNPMATILPTVTTIGYKPAPALIHFSAKGPSLASTNLLKPDITAPGVDILAAWPDEKQAIPGKKPPLYYIISGTSMSCPHTTGIVAAVMAKNPTFSASAIKSAIMTTALQTNNMNAPMTTSAGSAATPYDYGAGEANPTVSLEPGLVYETDNADYLLFLCAIGYNTSQIRLISSTVPKDFECPVNLTGDAISNINYPSIAISKLKEGEPKTVTRTVTNVGHEESMYTANIEALTGVEVVVTPNKLVFTKDNNKLTYKVTFTAKSSPKKDIFGAITWISGKYNVRSPIVASAE